MIESWTHNRTIFLPSYQSRQSWKYFCWIYPVENGKACAAHLLPTAIFITQSTSLMHFTITVNMAMHVSIEAQKQWLSELELYQINYKYFPETKVFPLYVEDYKLEKFNEIKKDGNSK